MNATTALNKEDELILAKAEYTALKEELEQATGATYLARLMSDGVDLIYAMYSLECDLYSPTFAVTQEADRLAELRAIVRSRTRYAV